MNSSKYSILSFIIVCGVSVLVVNCTSTTSRPESSASLTSVTTGRSSTGTKIPKNGKNTTNKSESKYRGDPLTLQLIENSSILVLQLFPREESLEITVTFDLDRYKTSNFAKNRHGGTNGSSRVNSTIPLKAKKINIGFDSHESKFVDVVAISLLPFEDTEKERQGVSKGEGTSGRSIGNDHVQDFHWIKKDGLLVPDSSHSYDLITFDVAKNQTIFSTTISRPWLTCDVQDIQFSMKPVEIWWMLEMSDSQPTPNPMKISNYAVSAQLKDENSTPTPGKKNRFSSSTTESTPSIENNGTLIEKNMTGGRNKGGTEGPKLEEVEILKSIKDHDFQGPITLSMEKLLRNYSVVLVKGCTTVSGKKKSEAQPVFNCSVKEYKGREDIQTYLRITGLVPLAEQSSSSSSSSTRKTFTEIEPEPCPTSFDNSTKSLYNALTGGNTFHPNNKKKNGGRESKNSSVNFPISHYPPHSALLLILLIFPTHIIT